MLEMPEIVTIVRQMDETFPGKTFKSFSRGVLTHKFLWLTGTAEEYNHTLAGRQVSGASSHGRSIILDVGDELRLFFGDLGGRILYHQAVQSLPARYHLRWDFTDGSALTYALQMWGFVGLLTQQELQAHPYALVGIPPLDEGFTFDRFDQLLEAYPEKTGKGVKGFLVTSKHINGIGNGYLQDILYRAKLHPARKIPTISPDERKKLYAAIQDTLSQAVSLGGRQEERDLFDQPGGYQRLMGSQTVGQPCPECGSTIQKIAYLGGACYLCPTCQEKP